MIAGKSYLYLGSADFRRPRDKAIKHSSVDMGKVANIGAELDPGGYPDHVRTLDAGYEVVATELNSRSEGREKYGNAYVVDNVYDIENVDGEVIESFDATSYPPHFAANRQFDRIIFENPHSGRYGDGQNGLADMQAAISNKSLLEGIFREAAKVLKPTGQLQISVCGWPFLSHPARTLATTQGLQWNVMGKAQEFADSLGYVFVDATDKGVRTVYRNNGTPMQLNVTKFKFRLK
ncbi:MAG: DUF2431 domain-containing protein [Magnetospirillum sp.]|nr:DUF2431 domain-containing protein [Magnetospirillum sp.]